MVRFYQSCKSCKSFWKEVEGEVELNRVGALKLNGKRELELNGEVEVEGKVEVEGEVEVEVYRRVSKRN